jgi:hypothetical protein
MSAKFLVDVRDSNVSVRFSFLGHDKLDEFGGSATPASGNIHELAT